ncbi:hypothetical protein TrVGV298_010980, partial [Trichoderma virens]
GSQTYPQCTNFFKGCHYTATSNTCGAKQSCGLNGCGGVFNLDNGKAYCSQNFIGCECQSNPGTCGQPQSCDKNNCAGAFQGNTPTPVCTDFFQGCQCVATSNTCGAKQSCDLNGCAGGYDSSGVARCQGKFQGCACNPTSNTCGTAQNCDLNGCKGSFDSNSNTARCRGNFTGCVCKPVPSCSINGCNGGFDSSGNIVCKGNFYGCPCIPDPIWLPAPTTFPNDPDPPASTLPPLVQPWYCLGVQEQDYSNAEHDTPSYWLAARNRNTGHTDNGYGTGTGYSARDLCRKTLGGATVIRNGDPMTQCSGYGIALWNSRSCRTHCASLGDKEKCFEPGTDELFLEPPDAILPLPVSDPSELVKR